MGTRYVLCPLKNFYLTLTSLQDILLPLTMPTTVTTKQLIIDINNLNSFKWKLLLWNFFNERQKKPQKNFLVAFEDNLVYDFIYSTFERNIVCSFQAQLFEKWTRFELLARRGNFWDFFIRFPGTTHEYQQRGSKVHWKAFHSWTNISLISFSAT